MDSWTERAIVRVLAGGRARPPRANPVLVAYRWRYELAVVVLGVLGCVWARDVGWLPPVGILLAAVLVVAPWPAARRVVAGRYWAVVVQHRLRSGFFESGLTTYRGRRPAILWSSPRASTVRVVVSLPAGIETSDVTRARGTLAASCFASDMLVERHPRFGNLVVLVVVIRSSTPSPRA